MTLTQMGIDPEGPCLRLAADERQRDGEAVVDVHLIHDRQVELIIHKRFRDVPRKWRMALHDRDMPGPISLVSGIELLGATDRKSRRIFEREAICMIIVDDNHDVGFHLGEPFSGGLVALENRLPVGLSVGPVDDATKERHVRCAESSDDLSQLQFPSSIECRPLERPPAFIMSSYSLSDMPDMMAFTFWKGVPSKIASFVMQKMFPPRSSMRRQSRLDTASRCSSVIGNFKR